MPRLKTPAAPRAKKGATAVAKVAAKRTRRSPFELVQELRTKRDQLRESMESRIAKLDERITTLETKYEHKIKVSELLQTRSAEELAKELEALRTQQSLLRKAIRTQNKQG